MTVEEQELQSQQFAPLGELRELLQEDIRAVPIGHADLGCRIVRMIDAAQADNHRPGVNADVRGAVLPVIVNVGPRRGRWQDRVEEAIAVRPYQSAPELRTE